MERTGGGVENSGADIGLVVWSLLTFCLLSGPATGDQHAHCSEFLRLSPPTLLVRLLRFSSEQGPCGSPLDLPPSGLPSGQGLPPLPPGLPGLAPGPVTWIPLSPTVVIVPGRRPARLQPSWARVMAGELLEAGLVNVLVADWLLPPEQEITEGARQVGERLAQTIQTLLEVQGSSPELFHLVGFGVGAHVAGVTGACLEGTIGRITGLDPFSPLFSEADSSLSLDHTDAQYVDVIHTNFNPNEPVAPLGVPRPLGHVDFYIGRGNQLPGCPQSLMKREQYLLCSHQRAYRLFTSSIRSSTSSIRSSCPLTAFPCQGVEDFQRALCTHCHHPGLNICPQLGKRRDHVNQLGKRRDHVNQLGKRRDHVNQLGKRRDHVNQLGKRRDHVNQLGKIRDNVDQLGKRHDNVDQLGKRRDHVDQLGKRRDNVDQLGKRRDNVDQLGKRHDNVDQLGKRHDNVDQLGKRRDHVDQLGKRRDNVDQLGKRRDHVDQLGKRRDHVDQLGKRRDHVDQLSKRRDNVAQLGKRHDNVDQLGKRRDHVDQLGKRHDNVDQLGKRRDNVDQLGKRRDNVDQLGKRRDNVDQLGKRHDNVDQLGKRRDNVDQLGKRRDNVD
ncbi:uncharacterized protein LOC129832525 [Salvelinus fontinalis]|uniref:uncharacterized protein LOC129832525 n=1 Tax=Salvelinus fontinalis TaxID=8038 RepID=UPI002485A2D0|nr:uncharacterized protein LOC129832525 [Salvelinus fontinalis]